MIYLEGLEFTGTVFAFLRIHFPECEVKLYNSIRLTELNEGVRPHHAADPFGVVGDQELLLQLVQEAEGQHVGVAGAAHHQVSDAQRAGEAETR